MRLTVKRIALRGSYTIGRLYVNGAYECDTLEDAVRDKKVNGATAIPYGTYKVRMDVVSPRFVKQEFYRENANGARLPRLVGVPGFDGVLIHCGNTSEDTEGCILVGLNKVVGKVVESRETFRRLYRKMMGAVSSNDPITIEIV